MPTAWGSRPGRLGPITVVLGAVAGGVVTVLARAEPGTLLGLFVIAATIAGGFAVRRGSAYLTIPIPAPAYFVVAMLTGLVHDRAIDASGAVLAVNAAQWIAGGFFFMCAATALAIAITVSRWLMTGRAAYGHRPAWAVRRAAGPTWTPPARAGASRTGASRPGASRTSESQTGGSETGGSRISGSHTASPRGRGTAAETTQTGTRSRRAARAKPTKTGTPPGRVTRTEAAQADDNQSAVTQTGSQPAGRQQAIGDREELDGRSRPTGSSTEA